MIARIAFWISLVWWALRHRGKAGLALTLMRELVRAGPGHGAYISLHAGSVQHGAPTVSVPEEPPLGTGDAELDARLAMFGGGRRGKMVH